MPAPFVCETGYTRLMLRQQNAAGARLVLRFRSSHHFAATSCANFGNIRSTSNFMILVRFMNLKFLRWTRSETGTNFKFTARVALALAAWLIAPPAGDALAQTIVTPQREKKQFTDAEIADGFFKVAFGAEFHLAGHVDRIRKYDKPVRVFIDNKARPDRRAKMREVIADIGRRIEHIDIAEATRREDANVTVTLVRDRDLHRTIAAFYGADRAREIKKAIDPQCLSSFTKDDNFAIVSSNVILAVDAGSFVFSDCAYEELLQALGPINDTDSVPWTTFNDNVSMSHFGIYDQYLLNILYHPRMRPGMKVDEVKTLLPEILPDVRAFVARSNGLKN